MGKVAKARKSTHTKKKLTTESRGKVLRREEDETNKEYEIDEIGPIYLLWAKKKVRNEKGKTVKKFYIEKDEKHLIWIKWTKSFKGTDEINWSAEPQESLRGSGLGQQVDEVLRSKKIWPFPSKHDGEDSGWQERVALCKANKYQIWQSKKKEEKGAEWILFNGVEAASASSDASTRKLAPSSPEPLAGTPLAPSRTPLAPSWRTLRSQKRK